MNLGDRTRPRLFRLLLRLLPEEFRAAYASEMEVTFRDELHDAARPTARLRTWAIVVGQLLRVAPIEHARVFAGDARFAYRTMAARPGHTAAAVLTLALGIAATIAMVAVIDAVLLAPLPYRQPESLTAVGETGPDGAPGPTGYLSFVDLRDRSRSFSTLVGATQSFGTLAGGGRDAERVGAMRVSRAYFDMIGVQPTLGRAFLEQEDRPGPARRVTILSHALWQRRFAADPSIIERVIDISGIPFRVVGVMPPGFNDLVAARVFGNAELWFPLGYDPAASFACRTCRHLSVFGRLAPGVSAAQATQEAGAIFAALEREHPTDYHGAGARVTPLGDLFLGPVRTVLAVLAVGVALLLVIACSNVAGLQLLRATEREREMAIRTALGVTRRRLARQLLTEAVLLSGFGAALGLLAAYLIVNAIAPFDLPAVPRLGDVAIHAREVIFTIGIAVVSGVAVGLVPLGQLFRHGTIAGLQGAGARTASAGTTRLRSILVGANVALAALLLVGSGLLVRSLTNLLAVSPGVDAAHVATLQVFASGRTFGEGDNPHQIAAAVRFYDDVLSRVRALPGVLSAAAVTTLPLDAGIDRYGLHVEGRLEANPEAAPSGDRFVVTPGFFETLRIPLARGRYLNGADRQTTEPVMVINRAMADGMFAGEEPIGRRIHVGPVESPLRRIVGIVGNVRHGGLDISPTYQFYVPQAQWPWSETYLTLVVRTSGDAAGVIAPVRDVVRGVDAAQPVENARLYQDVINASLGTRRPAAWLLTGFAITALLLAVVGLYGAVGVRVGQRRTEIAVRLALGARAAGILRMVLAQSLRPVLLGLAAGLTMAALLTQTLTSFLHHVDALDPGTFAAVAALLVTCAVAACYVPAARAARIDPARTLRT
jgi:putative ABC transport system permease protein